MMRRVLTPKALAIVRRDVIENEELESQPGVRRNHRSKRQATLVRWAGPSSAGLMSSRRRLNTAQSSFTVLNV